jgi:hypothetical protein
MRSEDLTKMLSETLGNAAFDKAAADDAALGNAPMRSVAQNPPATPSVAAPEGITADPSISPAAPSPQTAEPVEGQPGAGGKLLLGKYKTEPEAEKGYYNLLQQNKILLSQLDKLKESVTPQAPTFTEPAKADPSVVSTYKETLQKLEEVTGLEATELANLFTGLARDVAKPVAAETYKELTEPQRRIAEADSFMEVNYPESTKFQDEIVSFAKTDPIVGPLVNELWNKGLYKEALMQSYMGWKLNSGIQEEHRLTVAEEVRREEVAKSKLDAGLVTTNAQGAREAAPTGPSSEEMDALIRAHRAGHTLPLLRATIGRTLNNEIFGDGE